MRYSGRASRWGLLAGGELFFAPFVVVKRSPEQQGRYRAGLQRKSGQLSVEGLAVVSADFSDKQASIVVQHSLA